MPIKRSTSGEISDDSISETQEIDIGIIGDQEINEGDELILKVVSKDTERGKLVVAYEFDEKAAAKDPETIDAMAKSYAPATEEI